MRLLLLSQVLLDGAAEADRDNEAALGLFGGVAEGFRGEDLLGGFGKKARHFSAGIEHRFTS